MDDLLTFLGELVLFGGGGVAVAYVAFRFLLRAWIEEKFAKRLESFRHEQAKELQVSAFPN